MIFTLDRYDNQRHLTCQASNTVTEDRAEEPVKTSHLLQVQCAVPLFTCFGSFSFYFCSEPHPLNECCVLFFFSSADAPSVFVSPDNITVNESMDVLIFCTYDANPVTLTSVRW